MILIKKDPNKELPPLFKDVLVLVKIKDYEEPYWSIAQYHGDNRKNGWYLIDDGFANEALAEILEWYYLPTFEKIWDNETIEEKTEAVTKMDDFWREPASWGGGLEW